MKKIFYNKHLIDAKDKAAVISALNEDLITGGKNVQIFEHQLKKFLNVRYTKTCINGTAALHMAYESINLKKNEIVIMPIINFIAAFSMANLYEAKIYFADVDPLSGQMTPETLVRCIKINKLKKVKAVIIMHMGGYPNNIYEFYKIKKKYKFFLIEDACHAFGAKYLYKKENILIGSCKHSDVCLFSFHPVKSITTGEGGLICTNNTKLYKRIKYFGSHNIVRKKKYWDYNIYKLGFNYRLSDINCALGISQLKKISLFIKKRKAIYKIYEKSLKKLSKHVQILKYDQKNTKPCYHLFIVKINFNLLKSTKNTFINYLNSKNIFTQFHYKPIIKFKFFKNKKLFLKNFSGANDYYKNNISLPIYVDMKKAEIIKVIKYINLFVKNKL